METCENSEPKPQTLIPHRQAYCPGHDSLSLLPAWCPSTACASLEFSEAPTDILTIPHAVAILAIMYLVFDIAAVLERVVGREQCSDV